MTTPNETRVTIKKLDAKKQIVYGEVPGYPGYMVGVCGTVTGKAGKTLKPIKHRNGYAYVTLYRDGVPRICAVHRLVLEIHDGPCPKGHTAAHRNGVRDDNRLENLYWATWKQQWEDKETHGTYQRGSRIGTAKLDEETVRLLKQRIASVPRDYGSRWRETVAAEFNISRATVEQIAAGVRWRHV